MSRVMRRVTNVILAGCILAATIVGSAGAATETVLYSFKGGGDGENPEAALINVGGTLYGTTFTGGASGCGTVFSITPAGVEKVLHSFNCGSEGSNPAGGLINVAGTLYGTTSSLGAFDAGTVFSMTRAGVLKVLYSFGKSGAQDALKPAGGLIDVAGTLYGTSDFGGANDKGTVFSVTLAGVEKVLYSFGDESGAAQYPVAVYPSGLVNLNGTLYGTTDQGGNLSCSGGCGTVFSVTLAGVEQVLHSFTGGSDGSGPVAGLIGVGGTLYGTTADGGTSTACKGGCGTVFSITPAGVEKVLHSFGGFPGGRSPFGNLLNVNGVLYGTAVGGGYPANHRDGTVFSITRAGSMKVLHYFFGSSDGAYPYAGVTDVSGTFYGTTYQGGAFRYGTVFKVTP